MTTAVVLPWSFPGPTSGPASGPTPRPVSPACTASSRRLLRLRLMLIRDEQVRRPPAITLPHLLAGHPADPPRAPESAPAPPIAARPPIAIATVLEVVARHFDVPAGALVGQHHRGGSSARPIAQTVAIALAKAITGATYAEVERALDAGAGAGWAAVSKIRHLRTVDPDLARRLSAIEAELSATQKAAR